MTFIYIILCFSLFSSIGAFGYIMYEDHQHFKQLHEKYYEEYYDDQLFNNFH